MGMVAMREVRHEAGDADLRDVGELRGERLEVGHAHAETGHAGVDLEVRDDRTSHGTSRASEALDLRDVVDDGNDVTRCDLFAGSARAGVEAAHDEDGSADARVTELDRLLEERDAEALGAGALQRTCHGGRTMTVTVGLEHGPDVSRRARAGCFLRVTNDDAEVVSQSGEVHLGARGPDRVGGSRASRLEHANAVVRRSDVVLPAGGARRRGRRGYVVHGFTSSRIHGDARLVLAGLSRERSRANELFSPSHERVKPGKNST
jgi:hypothetical protein